MGEKTLVIRDYQGKGYKPLIDYEKWRVAILRYQDDLRSDRIDAMERHTKTDEVFVLLQGKGVLIIGGNETKVNSISPQVMEPGKIYNVKCNAWHAILLSREASVLIVENSDTDRHNSEYASLSAECRRLIQETATKEKIN
jgi:ureidoglycolate hydrolase